MRRALTCFFGVLLLMFWGCAPSDEAADGPLVLAASSLQEAMEAAADAWAAKGHARPVLSFAASSALARQIEAGAQGDIFVSADEEWMDVVSGKGLIAVETRRPFLHNSLVLVSPAETPARLTISPGFPLAGALGGGRLAMADPDAVPAGRYGKAALIKLGVWGAVSARIANAENVRAALALVSRGEAPLGIVYATDARADKGVAIVDTFPQDSHPPIIYPIARLASSSNPDADGFLAYLCSEEGQAVFRNFGFESL